MKPLDLIETSKSLLSSSKGKPTAASLRRATSSAYYALFHCLARNCADLLVGGSGSTRSLPAWRQVYRSIEHAHAKKQCKDKHVIRKFPKEVEDFANLFVILQEKRHEADYDPFAFFVKSAVYADIIQATEVIYSFERVKTIHRRAFCVWVLLKDRISR